MLRTLQGIQKWHEWKIKMWQGSKDEQNQVAFVSSTSSVIYCGRHINSIVTQTIVKWHFQSAMKKCMVPWQHILGRFDLETQRNMWRSDWERPPWRGMIELRSGDEWEPNLDKSMEIRACLAEGTVSARISWEGSKVCMITYWKKARWGRGGSRRG